MGKSWCNLIYRYGEEIEEPSLDEISAAVKELYVEDLPGMAENNYEEHGDAWLRYGEDDGPMYVLTITRSGRARWEEWADQNYKTKLCPAKEAELLPQETAILLWKRLAKGKIELVRAYFQKS